MTPVAVRMKGVLSDSLVLVVDGGHERSRGRKDIVHEDEDGLLRRELDPLPDASQRVLRSNSQYDQPDHVDKLSDSQVL